MDEQAVPESVNVTFCSLVALAVEYWRLSAWLAKSDSNASGSAPARHALRKLEDFLRQHELEVRSLDGEAFDPGLAVRVIDTVEDAGMPPERAVIEETLAPMVLYRGRVVKAADVVTRQGKA